MTTATLIPTAAPAPWRWSRADYYRLGEHGFFDGQRVELIRGEIVTMSPISWPHSLAVAALANVIRTLSPAGVWVNVQSPLLLGTSEPEPDVAIIAGEPRDYADHPTTALLVVEVAVTSLAYDLTTKAQLYAAAGIPLYWVLDVEGRLLHQFGGPTAAGYQGQAAFGEAEGVELPTGGRLRVVQVLP